MDKIVAEKWNENKNFWYIGLRIFVLFIRKIVSYNGNKKQKKRLIKRFFRVAKDAAKNFLTLEKRTFAPRLGESRKTYIMCVFRDFWKSWKSTSTLPPIA